MPKNIFLTLNNSGPDIGPYNVILYDSANNQVGQSFIVTKPVLTAGYNLTVLDSVVKVSVKSVSNNTCNEVELTIPTTKCPCRTFNFKGADAPTTFTYYECGRTNLSNLTIRNITVPKCIDATKPITKDSGPGEIIDTNICCTPLPTTTTTTSTSTTTTSTTTTSTTLIPPPTCKCYKLVNNSSNTQGFQYDGCNNFSYSENISGNSTRYICAKLNSIVVNQAFVTVSNTGTNCTDNASCVPPTTTTSTTTSTTTTTSTSTTTTIIQPPPQPIIGRFLLTNGLSNPTMWEIPIQLNNQGLYNGKYWFIGNFAEVASPAPQSSVIKTIGNYKAAIYYDSNLNTWLAVQSLNFISPGGGLGPSIVSSCPATSSLYPPGNGWTWNNNLAAGDNSVYLSSFAFGGAPQNVTPIGTGKICFKINNGNLPTINIEKPLSGFASGIPPQSYLQGRPSYSLNTVWGSALVEFFGFSWQFVNPATGAISLNSIKNLPNGGVLFPWLPIGDDTEWSPNVSFGGLKSSNLGSC